MKRRDTIATFCCLLAFPCIRAVPAPAAELQPLVGVQYFAGWWSADRPDSKWLGRDRQDWRGRYPGRVPLLGEVNDQATMDREIVAAADYGVNFFSILWYAGEADPERAVQESLLNRGLEHFLKSPQAPRLKFTIEYVNHPPFGVTSDAQWQRCVDTWIQAIRHPSYLRVGGRPVFKVHGGSLFLKQTGGNPAQSKTRLDSLRQAARQAGLGELLIGCGVGSGEAIPAGHWAAQVYNFSACYMDVPPQTPRAADGPWDLLARWTAERRQVHLQDAIPYLPYVAAGWNPRPWSDPRAAFAPPDRVQWRAALQELKEDLARGRLGLPLPDGRVQPACTIYAWNEFGEGGIVAPTQGDQYMKLEEIRQVFDRDSSPRGRKAIPTP